MSHAHFIFAMFLTIFPLVLLRGAIKGDPPKTASDYLTVILLGPLFVTLLLTASAIGLRFLILGL